MALTSFSQRMIGLFSTATLLFVFGLSAMATAEELIVEASESLEWKQDEGVYIATGNASAVQGNRSISGDVLTARYNPDEDAQSISQIIAQGNVAFADAAHNGSGQMLDYDQTAQRYILTGPQAQLDGPDGTARADDIIFERSQNHITLTGNAFVSLTDGRKLAGQDLKIFLDDAQNVSQIIAEGQVKVVQPSGQTATSDRADYNRAENTALFVGNVVIIDADSKLTGERAEIDFATGVSRMLSGTGSRVSGRFTINQN